MKSLTDSQLKTASIIDLTDDLDLMRSVLGDDTFEVSEAEDWGQNKKMIGLFSFAQVTNNAALLERLEAIFAKEHAQFFNE